MPSNDALDSLLPFFSHHKTDQHQYEWVSDSFRQAVINGQLKPGYKLPSSRALSKQLGVARNSIVMAYEILQAEGIIETRHGAGSFVSAAAAIPPLLTAEMALDQQHKRTPKLSPLGERINKPVQINTTGTLLLPAQPALERFPLDDWHTALNRAVRQRTFLSDKHIQGPAILRQQLVEHLSMTRGVKAMPEQILITSGSQQALSMVIDLLVGPKENVYVEDYGYQGVDGLLTAAGVRRVVLDTDDEGMVVDNGLNTLGAGLMIVTPSRSFPVGHTLSLARRLAMLNWADQTNSWILEDDYDSEFLYKGQPIASLQGMDTRERVIYTGTFSRTLFPGVRVGYLVLPDCLVEIFNRYRALVDGGIGSLVPSAIGCFMQSGDYARHLRRMKKCYQARQQRLSEVVAAHLPELISLPHYGGMHQVFMLPEGGDDQAITGCANQQGLGIRALSSYSRKQNLQAQGLIIGFSGTSEEQLPSAIIRLRQIIHQISD